MRRVKDQDEEGKGPRDQEDPGTRGLRDQGTRRPGDQRIRGTLNCFSSKFICVFQVLSFFPGNVGFFLQYHPFPLRFLMCPRFVP